MKTGIIATIGFFDGVHKGHQSLIRDLVHEASVRGLRSMVITFDRHPREVFAPNDVPLLLTTNEEKICLLKQCGVDEIHVLRFDPSLAALSASDFMRIVLRDELGVSALLVGYNHRFGKPMMVPVRQDVSDAGLRPEAFEDYRHYGQELGIDVLQAQEWDGGSHVSSSVVRKALINGDMERANAALGHFYTLSGEVVHGHNIGHRLGFPTANIQMVNARKLIPLGGVYAAWADVNGMNRVPTMVNIGKRPTFSGTDVSIEAHLLHFDSDLYGQEVTLSFVSRIRGERRFASEDELRRQLALDQAYTGELLNSVPTP